MRNFELRAPEYFHDEARVQASALKLFHIIGTIFMGIVGVITVIPQAVVVLADMIRLVFGIPYRMLLRASVRADSRLGARAEQMLPRIS